MWKETLDVALVAIGGCGLIWSVISGFRTAGFIKRAIETTGEVVDFEKSTSNGRFGNYDYAPIFRFVAADGKLHTITSNVGSSPPGFVIGERVRLRYDPAQPEKARIESLFQTWGEAIIASIIGIGLIAFAVLNECGAFHQSR